MIGGPVKPSGPLLFFVEIFLITSSISLLAIYRSVQIFYSFIIHSSYFMFF